MAGSLSGVSLSVAGEETVEEVVYFVVQCVSATRRWSLRKRYSEFDELRKAVSREVGSTLQPFPGKQMLKLSAQQVQRRSAGLDAWLRELSEMLEVPAAARAALADFVGDAPDEAPRSAAAIAPTEARPAAAAPAPAWDSSFMQNDPLAMLGLAPPAPPAAPQAAQPAAAPTARAAAPPPPPAAACPAAVPAAGQAPAFLRSAAPKTYDVTGEGLRDAVKAGDLDGVRRVLQGDASLANFQDRQMESMLHIAVIFNHADIALELVRHGADVGLKNHDKETACEIALPSLKAKILTEVEQLARS